MTNEELREQLLSAPKNGFTKLTEEQRMEMEGYCRRYAAFMDVCKTEREATAWAVLESEKRGFVPFTPGMTTKPGEGVFGQAKNKNIC